MLNKNIDKKLDEKLKDFNYKLSILSGDCKPEQLSGLIIAMSESLVYRKPLFFFFINNLVSAVYELNNKAALKTDVNTIVEYFSLGKVNFLLSRDEVSYKTKRNINNFFKDLSDYHETSIGKTENKTEDFNYLISQNSRCVIDISYKYEAMLRIKSIENKIGDAFLDKLKKSKSSLVDGSYQEIEENISEFMLGDRSSMYLGRSSVFFRSIIKVLVHLRDIGELTITPELIMNYYNFKYAMTILENEKIDEDVKKELRECMQSVRGYEKGIDEVNIVFHLAKEYNEIIDLISSN